MMDSQPPGSERILDAALEEIAQTSPLQTDGKWLEYLTRDCAPLIAEWDVSHAWLWQEWPDRGKHYPRKTDLGVDVVARRASDGALIAIQCKSRQLDEHGHGAPINAGEIDRFIALSADPLWAERWVVVNGAIKISDNAIDTARINKAVEADRHRERPSKAEGFGSIGRPRDMPALRRQRRAPDSRLHAERGDRDQRRSLAGGTQRRPTAVRPGGGSSCLAGQASRASRCESSNDSRNRDRSRQCSALRSRSCPSSGPSFWRIAQSA